MTQATPDALEETTRILPKGAGGFGKVFSGLQGPKAREGAFNAGGSRTVAFAFHFGKSRLADFQGPRQVFLSDPGLQTGLPDGIPDGSFLKVLGVVCHAPLEAGKGAQIQVIGLGGAGSQEFPFLVGKDRVGPAAIGIRQECWSALNGWHASSSISLSISRGGTAGHFAGHNFLNSNRDGLRARTRWFEIDRHPAKDPKVANGKSPPVFRAVQGSEIKPFPISLQPIYGGFHGVLVLAWEDAEGLVVPLGLADSAHPALRFKVI
jgi:hypothetical protein